MSEVTDNTGIANAPEKSFFSQVLKVVEAPIVFIGKEAGIIAEAFAKEEPQAQADLKAVSGIIQLIKTKVNQVPAVVIYLIKEAYPQFDEAKLLDLLTKGITALNTAETIIAPTLEETIVNIQKYAVTLTDDIAHNAFWSGLFNVLGSLVSVATPFGKIITYGVYLYNTYFKGKV